MTQPAHVPVARADRVRSADRLPASDGWRADRPAELVDSGFPEGPRFGATGPDGGYALTLAKRFKDKLSLQPGEHASDALLGAALVAAKRAALFGRAPVIYDVELALTLFGFLGGAPADLLTLRKERFGALSHRYVGQRELCDLVPEETLRLTPADVRAALSAWKDLLAL